MALVLLPLVSGSPFWVPLAAQSGPVVLSIAVGRSWTGTIYRGPLLIVTPLSATTTTWERGAVDLDGFTLFTGRAQFHPSSWPFGLYVSAGFGTGLFHANGSDAFGSAAYHTDADVILLAAGGFQSLTLGRSLPVLDLAAGVTAFRLRVPVANGFLGPPVRDYLSPGAELTLGIRYPVGSPRLQVEVRATMAVLYHDTEGLDGRFVSRPLAGPDHRWAPTAAVGAGLRFAL